MALPRGSSFETQIELIESAVEVEEGVPLSEAEQKALEIEEMEREQLEMSMMAQEKILQNYNLFSFLLLPFYTLISFVVFGKPYNFTEHMVINAYIQGITFLASVVALLLSVLISPTIYSISLFSIVLYYLYAYAKLYHLSFGKSILKLLKFIGVMAIIMILGMAVVFAYKALS